MAPRIECTCGTCQKCKQRQYARDVKEGKRISRRPRTYGPPLERDAWIGPMIRVRLTLLPEDIYGQVGAANDNTMVDNS